MTTTPAPRALAEAVAETPAKIAAKVETSTGTVTARPLPPRSPHGARRYLIVGSDGAHRAIIAGGAGRYVIEGSAYNTSRNPYLGTLARITADLGFGSDAL